MAQTWVGKHSMGGGLDQAGLLELGHPQDSWHTRRLHAICGLNHTVRFALLAEYSVHILGKGPAHSCPFSESPFGTP